MTRHVVIYEPDRTLIDRRTLARLTGRSVHTIRLRCPVAEYRDGRALYDADQVEKILAAIPKRRPTGSVPKRPKRSPNDVGYAAVHARLRRGKGNASEFQCSECGRQAKDWAYDHADPGERMGTSGPYSVDPAHYRPMCRSCHLSFDRLPRTPTCVIAYITPS